MITGTEMLPNGPESGQHVGIPVKYFLMPIYEFMCKKCCHHFEALVRIGGEKGVSCPECQSPDVQKLFSSFGIGGASNRLTASSNSCSTCSTKSCSTCR